MLITMKSILTTTLVILLSASAFFARAQERPGFPELKVKEDYAQSEAFFLQVTEWLTQTDLNTQDELRMQSNAFIMKWIMGSPTVNVGIGDYLLRLFDKNPQLFAIYMANNASFCISNKENKNIMDAVKAGLQAVVTVYRKGMGIKRSKALDKLTAAVDSNELEAYIIKNLKDDKLKDH